MWKETTVAELTVMLWYLLGGTGENYEKSQDVGHRTGIRTRYLPNAKHSTSDVR
jgi:hypothetical protein